MFGKYAYSAWAPNFGDRLKLSSTQINLVVRRLTVLDVEADFVQGTFGNFGMYTAGIPIGMLVDSKGPRPGVTLGAVALGIGYFSIYRCEDTTSTLGPWLTISSIQRWP